MVDRTILHYDRNVHQEPLIRGSAGDIRQWMPKQQPGIHHFLVGTVLNKCLLVFATTAIAVGALVHAAVAANTGCFFSETPFIQLTHAIMQVRGIKKSVGTV